MSTFLMCLLALITGTALSVTAFSMLVEWIDGVLDD